jgi:hypothetical protein
MTDQDRPPESIWLNDEALEEHFATVKARYGNPNSDPGDAVPLSQNELTRDLKAG